MILEYFKNKGNEIEDLASFFAHMTLATIFLWFGFLKFSAYEAGAIEGFVGSSPLMSWMYSIFSVQMVSNILGIVEMLTGLLIIIGMRIPVLGALGGLMACATFFVTVSFMFTVPVIQEGLGFPYLSPMPGQFLLKDVALFGLSFWILGSSLKRI